MSPAHDRTKVLFVDDSWYMQALVRDALESLGLDLLCGDDGACAVDMYRAEHPQLVLMDLVLPQLDGITAISDIRAFDPDARIVIVSGLLDEGTRLQASQLGVAGFLRKPFTPRELLATVCAHVPAASPAHELQATP